MNDKLLYTQNTKIAEKKLLSSSKIAIFLILTYIKNMSKFFIIILQKTTTKPYYDGFA